MICCFWSARFPGQFFASIFPRAVTMSLRVIFCASQRKAGSRLDRNNSSALPYLSSSLSNLTISFFGAVLPPYIVPPTSKTKRCISATDVTKSGDVICQGPPHLHPFPQLGITDDKHIQWRSHKIPQLFFTLFQGRKTPHNIK